MPLLALKMSLLKRRTSGSPPSAKVGLPRPCSGLSTVLACFSARPAAADDSLAEPATAGAAGARHTHQQAEGVPGRDRVPAECPAMVPAAARPGPGGPGQAAGRDGPHPGTAPTMARGPHCMTHVEHLLFFHIEKTSEFIFHREVLFKSADHPSSSHPMTCSHCLL